MNWHLVVVERGLLLVANDFQKTAFLTPARLGGLVTSATSTVSRFCDCPAKVHGLRVVTHGNRNRQAMSTRRCGRTRRDEM